MGSIIGVDEAGRGPVLGSLFVGAVAVDDRSLLPDGVDDSKVLTPDMRAALAARMAEDARIETACVELEVETIDRPGASLTEQVAEAFARCIDRLADAGDSVVTDAGEADTVRFTERIQRYLETPVDLEVRVRADSSDRLVGAASIVAKEAREAHVADLAERYGEIGSGYPSDSVTRRFLASYVETTGELPACARRSWSTSRDVLAAADQSAIGDFVEPSDRGH